MRFLSENDCVSWCSEHGIQPILSEPDFNFVKIPFPKDSGKKIVLARFLFNLLKPAPETLLWLGDWDVFPSSQHMPLFTRFREAVGETRPLIESPGHLIFDEDGPDAVSIIAVSLFFFWDCKGYSASGRDAFIISHDELCWFASRDLEVVAQVQQKVCKLFPSVDK